MGNACYGHEEDACESPRVPPDVCPAVGNGVALALEGGGFKALSLDVGLFAALLAKYRKIAATERPTLESSNLLGRFGVISSVSGGTWFASSLIYSRGFKNMVEDMAVSGGIKHAAEIFEAQWVSQWLSAFQEKDSKYVLHIASLLDRDLDLSAISDTVEMLDFVSEEGWAWKDLVRGLLESTVGIPSTATLDSEVQEWAKDKIWIVCHSFVSPTGSTTATLRQSPLGVEAQRYQVKGAGATPPFIPARFSWQLGSEGSVSPTPYMAGSALPPSSSVSWSSRDLNPSDGRCYCTSDANVGRCVGSFPEFTEAAGSLPIFEVASCSSAVVGGAITSPLFVHANSFIHANFPVWATSDSNGETFRGAERLVGPTLTGDVLLDGSDADFADAGLRALVDAAYTDNTGIGHAVATGAREVVSVVFSADSAVGLFKGPEKEQSLAPGISVILFNIFQESQSWARGQMEKFKSMKLGADSSLVSEISVGTIVATTAENRWFGIAAGQAVKLHFIKIESKLSTGFFQDFHDYAMGVKQLCCDLMSPENDELTSDILDILLHGGNFPGAPSEDSGYDSKESSSMLPTLLQSSYRSNASMHSAPKK